MANMLSVVDDISRKSGKKTFYSNDAFSRVFNVLLQFVN